MTPINIKIKDLFVAYLKKKKQNDEYCVEGIERNNKEKVVKELLSCLKYNSYFVYKEGSTQFNEKLFIVPKAELNQYLFDYEYTVYDPVSLSFFETRFSDIYTEKTIIDGQISISANGVFEEMLLHLASKFKYIDEVSNLPKLVKNG